MQALPILRFLLPLLGLGIFAVAAKLIRPPKSILFLTLKLCWVAGTLNLLWDIIGTHYRFWHFTISHLLFGLPLDLYVTVSLVYGGALLLLYWWLRTKHSGWVPIFVVILPFYGVLRDYLGQKATGATFLVWDNSYWWIPDFFGWATGLWSLIFIFEKLAKAYRLEDD
jgi:hypothetical protein